MAGRLGDILVARGQLTQEQLETALRSQGSDKGMLGAILLRRGWVTREQVGSALSEQFEVPFETLVPDAVNPQLVRLLPEEFSRTRYTVPVALKNRRLVLAMAAPDDIEAISEAELITGYPVDPIVAFNSEIGETLDRGFDDKIVARQTIVDMKLQELAKQEDHDEGAEQIAALNEEESAPVVRLVKSLLSGAINSDSSDIHLEPHKPEMRVRYRVDGQLQQVMTIPNHIEEAVIARIKVMGDMDTTETRRPQDGHISIDDGGKHVNFRVSTIPTVLGEKVVMRLIDESSKVFRMDQLGFSDVDRVRLQELIDKPHGMLVVTGPTGSGKSTTLYAMLSQLNQVHRNIVTVEDPVEYRLPGITQVHSDNEFGLGFANALKYIMRQDPDVIMVGEIRDHETATTAVQAALTGHLLISTLHTNDAVGSVARLNDLGIDHFRIGGSLLGSVAQRLLRTICPFCKEPAQPNQAMLETLARRCKIPVEATFYHGRGCNKCLGSGYQGRVPVFEIMSNTAKMSEAIDQGMPHSKLRELAIEEGMTDLLTAGVKMAVAGRTTLEEAYFKTMS
ncbi:GspE/PulE family protein [Bremerella cremea]|uniref:Type II/IV secretion system protein n=1 Tax=Blastopirellula marina TaxID=124 RepID=A0A2S8FDY2_9BACT|nr:MULTISPECIES: GspE/PulE family protein [Pirellulaceae]PQO30381.1 type II/IV secretion system protein [Blastopirellula marina]RCS43733.1 GspE/PulE family protein [Bremerella cremea]